VGIGTGGCGHGGGIRVRVFSQNISGQVIHSTILPPGGGAFVFNGPIGGAFLSPEGRSVAFIARVEKLTQLWIRPLDSFSARALPGTEDASFAFWSPDSRNLGFFSQGKLKRIAIAGDRHRHYATSIQAEVEAGDAQRSFCSQGPVGESRAFLLPAECRSP
jgi:hypothetical protein